MSEIVETIYEEIENSDQYSDKDFLFVFDDVKNETNVQEYLKKMPANLKVLITTRNSRLFSDMSQVSLFYFTNFLTIVSQLVCWYYMPTILCWNQIIEYVF